MSDEQTNVEKCWFCANGSADRQAAAEVGLHRFVDPKDLVITIKDEGWEGTTVQVPRCLTCKAVHDRTENHVGRGAVAGLLVGIPLAVLMFIFFFRGLLTLIGFVIGVAVLGGIIGWAISLVFSPQGVKDQGQAAAHPDVRRKELEGWKLGRQPAG